MRVNRNEAYFTFTLVVVIDHMFNGETMETILSV